VSEIRVDDVDEEGLRNVVKVCSPGLNSDVASRARNIMFAWGKALIKRYGSAMGPEPTSGQ